MSNISKIRSISLWVFIIPLITTNLCLIIVTMFQQYIPHGVGIGPTFPYLDGGTSISRTARNFPTNLVFKPGMIVTSFLLIRYWTLNKQLLSIIEPLNTKSVNYFFIFGILSAVFLILHAIFLGIKFDNDFYKLFRRVIMLSFIIFEIVAQAYLVATFYSFRNKLKNYINIRFLNLKIILVTILIIVALISIPIISLPGDNFIGINLKFLKHALEWDYFLGVISFYLLTFFMWRKI